MDGIAPIRQVDQSPHWYLLGSVSRNQELRIRDELRTAGYECFVPLRYDVRTVHQRRERTVVPALAGLIFIRGVQKALQEDLRTHRGGLYLRKSTFSNHTDYITVSDRDMENFIAVTEKAGEKIVYFNPDEIQLRPGDRIRVKGGLYDGREGVIMRIKGKRRKQLVVSIPGILIAAVEMEPDIIELASSESTEKPEKPTSMDRSKNLDKDKALLFSLAKRLLFEIPEAYQHEKEYYLLLAELKRTVDRLQPFKGYLPSQEVELALPLYMAAVKLQTNVEEAEARLRTALQRLQPTSNLRLRAQLYLARLSNDEAALAEVKSRLDAWLRQKRSKVQEEILEEYNRLFPKND